MADEYEVLYDWEPENPEDLRLFAGETLIVLEKHDHGWWLGSVDRTGEVQKGYFPKNYVKERPKVNPAPAPPPRPTSLANRALPPTVPDISEVAGEVSKMSVSRGPTFSLRTLPAFDSLTNRGFAVELVGEKEGDEASKVLPQAGDLLSLEVTAATWDGARGGISVYAEGTVSFVLGGGSAGGVVKGLEEGVKEVPVGSKATITCAPSMAYGNAGAPPAVPPNSFVVLTITLVSAAPAPSPVPSPEGP
eukprot:gene43987-53776_t